MASRSGPRPLAAPGVLALFFIASVTGCGPAAAPAEVPADRPGVRRAAPSHAVAGTARTEPATVEDGGRPRRSDRSTGNGRAMTAPKSNAPDPSSPGDERPARYVIDRIEDGRWAVLEDATGRTIDVPRAWLPADVREGTTVRIEIDHETEGSTRIRWTVDADAGQARSERIRSLRDSLERAPSDDLDL